MKKDHSPLVNESFIEFIRHIQATYASCSIILEPQVARQLHRQFSLPIYTPLSNDADGAWQYQEKVDLTATLGGDGTILHASSLFSGSLTVPPILSFSMGTLGFLGEWKFAEYKKAFREVYVSGAEPSHDYISQQSNSARAHQSGPSLPTDRSQPTATAPAPPVAIRGKLMGPNRTARILLRNRLKVGIFTPSGTRIPLHGNAPPDADLFAMNEVILHRGSDPHLTIVDVFVGGRFLTEAVADGMIVSTPTGSTAYSLSSGGSIVHPLVSSLLLTPVCPRSLSFRPLVLPGSAGVTLRLSGKNRGRRVDVSIDGTRRGEGLEVGMEVRVAAEDVRDGGGKWVGGVPSVVRARGGEGGSEDSWVGGLNGLLKFNYPMGEE